MNSNLHRIRLLNTEDASAETARNIAAHVRRQLMGQLRDFRVSVRNSGIILQGCAPTYYVKQLAQHAVMQVSALSILANDIEVSIDSTSSEATIESPESPLGFEADDSRLASRCPPTAADTPACTTVPHLDFLSL